MPTRLSSALTPWLMALLAVQIVGFAHTIWFFSAHAYLPAPFVYDKSDTFMDFFHPLFWAGQPGRYSIWQSVYPPLNFLLLQMVDALALAGFTPVDGFEIRAAFPRLAYWIGGMALVSALVAFRIAPFRSLALSDQVLLFLFFIIAPPYLFAVERGNLILLALPFLALALAHAGWTRMVSIAILINLKPYFCLLSILYVVQRRFDRFILTGLIAAFVFLMTGLFLDPNFPLLFANLFNFSQSASIFSGREVLAMPSSISAFAYVAELAIKNGTADRIFGESITRALSFLSIVNITIVLSALALIGLMGTRIKSAVILSVLIIAISNLGVSIGGYSLCFVFLCLPALSQCRFRFFYVSFILMMFLPLDILVLMSSPVGIQNVYLSGISTDVIHHLGLGSLLRPVLNLALLTILTGEIVLEFWAKLLEHHKNGKALASFFIVDEVIS